MSNAGWLRTRLNEILSIFINVEARPGALLMQQCSCKEADSPDLGCTNDLKHVQMARQYSLCQVRRQSICVRYEDVLQDWKGWLYAVRNTFGLQTRAGFPQQVTLLFWQLCAAC